MAVALLIMVRVLRALMDARPLAPALRGARLSSGQVASVAVAEHFAQVAIAVECERDGRLLSEGAVRNVPQAVLSRK